MIRSSCAVVFVATVVGRVPYGHAQPPPGTLGSTTVLDEARRLAQSADKYADQGEYRKAEPLYVRALDIREKMLGPMHPDVAESLNNLALLYKLQGEYGKVEPLYARSLGILEKAFGPMHPDVALSLNNLAHLYQDQGAYEKAEPLYVRSLGILEKTLGPAHPDVALSLNNLAGFYADQGAYGRAEPLYVRALGIREKVLGPMHPDVAQSLNNLAGLYQDRGAFGKAEPLYVRALGIQEKTLGPTHPDVAAALNSLAILYIRRGSYEKAERLCVRALGIVEKALGPMHPNVATNLGNLAYIYREQGVYAKAEPLYARALGIVEKTSGPGHPDVARVLTGLALLYTDQAAYDKAEPLNVRALSIREKVLGPMHPEVATSLNNLAVLYQEQGAYAKAEQLYVRALGILEKALGPMDEAVAASLNNLGGLYATEGMYAKAEPLYVRAVSIWEKALGPIHAQVAIGLHNLAVVYHEQGMYERAEPLYARALDIRKKVLGPMHAHMAISLHHLAELYSAQGDHARALPLWGRVAEIREEGLRVELARLSEPRKRALMTLIQGETEALVSLHATQMPSSRRALELALTTVLRRKGRILDSLVEGEATLRAHLTPPLRAQLDRLSGARTELVVQLYAHAGPRSEMDLAAIADARARVEELESALSEASAEFRARSEPVTVATIQAALPAGAALVEFVRYQRHDARQPLRPWQEERYVAYLLTSNGPPRWVPLGAAKSIETEVDAVLATMNRTVAPETTKAALRRLDALVLAPVRARLTNVSHMIVAPDSKLNLVPFESLVDPEGHYALERYLVSYVTTGRDLLRLGTRSKARSSAVIVAAPDYGPAPSPVAGRVVFAPLAGALGEATDLRRYFPTSLLTGPRATKSALKALTGPAMLHVATHGFYSRYGGAVSRTATAGAPVQRNPERGMFVEEGLSLPRPRQSQAPTDALDRAGLAMAGANQGPDGIMTAREIAGLDLWGTQLVVLSACQTGVGVMYSGEGVYGLRRAFVLAGAESQVVSLWNVSDSTMRELMRDYYARLAQGAGRAEALRQAKLHLMHQPGRAHPYYWAAFIQAGDWRPLAKGTIRR